MYRNSTDKVGSFERLSRKQCAASCCSTVGCTHWQEQADNGCFHNDKSSGRVKCDDYVSIYTGGKKAVKTSPAEMLFQTRNSSIIMIERNKKKTMRQQP